MVAFGRPSLVTLASRASHMRAVPTASEHALWQALRGRQLGVQFRRQWVIGRYIEEFCAPGARLVVEVDGGYHGERRATDASRDRALARAGYRVLRLSDALVTERIEEAIALVRAALRRQLQP